MHHAHVRRALACLLLLPAAACGDGSTTPPQTGAIQGSVTTAEGGVPDVSLALSGGGSRTTNAAGEFRFDDVQTGDHTLTMTQPQGFDLEAGHTLAKPVTVVAGQTASVSWSLRPQTSTGTVDTVRLSGTNFEPQSLTVQPGGTVVWVNTQDMSHTVTPDGHTAWARATTSAPGEVLRVTFDNTGAFDYFCEPHESAGMTGRITVQQ